MIIEIIHNNCKFSLRNITILHNIIILSEREEMKKTLVSSKDYDYNKLPKNKINTCNSMKCNGPYLRVTNQLGDMLINIHSLI